MIQDAFAANQGSIFAHRVLSQMYLDYEDYDQARKLAEAGLSLVAQYETEFGRQLPLYECILSPLVTL